jgi:hypothetical protein
MTPLERQLNRWGLLPRHEQLTELYIRNGSRQAGAYKPGQVHTVAFEVRNLEAETKTYSYAITVSDADGRAILNLKEGDLTIKQGETRRVNMRTTLQDIGEVVYISIGLSNGQAVGYWLEKE